MRVKFDDGEHATVLDGPFESLVPDVGHSIDWDWDDPGNEDALVPGRYHVVSVEWRIAADTGVFLTIGLEPV